MWQVEMGTPVPEEVGMTHKHPDIRWTETRPKPAQRT